MCAYLCTTFEDLNLTILEIEIEKKIDLRFFEKLHM